MTTSISQSSSEMNQIFGDFIENLPPSQEYLILGLSPSSVPLKQRWRNSGLSADFLADYLTTFVSNRENDTLTIDKQADIKSAISYIANELLENAMKFNDETFQEPINVQIHLYSNRIVLATTNSISSERVGRFQADIKELTTSDPNELYIRQLEKNAEAETSKGSGIGLITLLNDYGAKLGWKFETVQKNSEAIMVTTMVQLDCIACLG